MAFRGRHSDENKLRKLLKRNRIVKGENAHSELRTTQVSSSSNSVASTFIGKYISKAFLKLEERKSKPINGFKRTMLMLIRLQNSNIVFNSAVSSIDPNSARSWEAFVQLMICGKPNKRILPRAGRHAIDLCCRQQEDQLPAL